MPPALPRCAHARIVLRPHPVDVQNDLIALPGVKVVRGIYHVPYHALEYFSQRLAQHGVAFQSAAWSRPPPEPVPWETVEASLR